MALSLPRVKSLTFWHFQIAGWSILLVVHTFINLMTRDWPLWDNLMVLLQLLSAFFLTLLLRIYYKKIDYRRKSIASLLITIAIGSMLFLLVWLCSIYVIRYIMLPQASFASYANLQNIMNEIYVIFTLPFAWSCLYFAIKIRLDWDQAKERAVQTTSLAHNAQLQMLQYQLNPHFIFNVLNSLRALVDEDEQGAKTMVSELSEFLRYSLLDKKNPEVLLKDELTAIHQYLSIQKKGYEDKLDITYTIDPRSEKIPILSFLIHPLVENAVKYGMQTSPMPLRIRIETEVINDKLKITVANTGRWVENAPSNIQRSISTGTGLENIRARLENALPGHHKITTVEKDNWIQVIVEIDQIVGAEHEEEISGYHR
jgi:sensor histidine kinase YesM